MYKLRKLPQSVFKWVDGAKKLPLNRLVGCSPVLGTCRDGQDSAILQRYAFLVSCIRCSMGSLIQADCDAVQRQVPLHAVAVTRAVRMVGFTGM